MGLENFESSEVFENIKSEPEKISEHGIKSMQGEYVEREETKPQEEAPEALSEGTSETTQEDNDKKAQAGAEQPTKTPPITSKGIRSMQGF